LYQTKVIGLHGILRKKYNSNSPNDNIEIVSVTVTRYTAWLGV